MMNLLKLEHTSRIKIKSKMDINKIIKKMRKNVSINFDEADELVKFLMWQDERLKEFKKSRDNWRSKYFKLKNEK